METPQHIKEILSNLPLKPGVYQYFDKNGKILYVGKAKKLKNRVSSYFNKNRYENGKTRLLVKKIDQIEFVYVSGVITPQMPYCKLLDTEAGLK